MAVKGTVTPGRLPGSVGRPSLHSRASSAGCPDLVRAYHRIPFLMHHSEFVKQVCSIRFRSSTGRGSWCTIHCAEQPSACRSSKWCLANEQDAAQMSSGVRRRGLLLSHQSRTSDKAGRGAFEKLLGRFRPILPLLGLSCEEESLVEA